MTKSPRRQLSHLSAKLLIPALALVVVLATGCPPDKTPPGNVTTFAAVAGDAQVALQWVNPGDDDFEGVRILRKAGGYPANPQDGAVVYEGAAQAATDTGLTNGITWHYAAFSYDAGPNYSSGAQAAALPTSAAALPEVLDSFSFIGETIAGVPGNVLDEGQQAELEEVMDNAETAYRQGDPCGAAGYLAEGLDLAQAFRQGAATGAVENLYNLFRLARYNMILGNGAKANCPGLERVGMEVEPEVDPAVNDTSGVDADISIGEPMLLTREIEGEIYTEVRIPGAESEQGPEGEPAVPMIRRLVGVPEGAQVEVTVDIVDAGENIKMNLFPYQPPQFTEPVQPQPAAKANYDKGSVFPEVPYRILDVGSARDVRMAIVEIPAGQYNAATQTFSLYRDVKLSVRFPGSLGSFATEASTSGFEAAPFLNGITINKDTLLAKPKPRPFPPNELGEELLILTHPAFRSAALDLATWKNTKGLITNVFNVNDGAGPGPDSAAEIDQFIEARYNNNTIRPSYILLLGDNEYIPCFQYPSGFAASVVFCYTIGSDWGYADRSGGPDDRLPDFAVGRLPVDTLSQARDVVAKIISYEKEPPVNHSFYSTAAVLSYFQCCVVNTSVPAGAEQMGFISDTEYDVRTLRDRGYSVQRLYSETFDGAYTRDTTPRSLRGGAETMPSDIAPGSGFTWNATTANVSAAFNAGRWLMIYVDHGNNDGWANPPFGSPDVDALTNGALQPFVLSLACVTGIFDNEVDPASTGTYMTGTTTSGVYFAERLMRKANGGAIGVIAATRVSMLAMYLHLQKGFLNGLLMPPPIYVSEYMLMQPQHRMGNVLNAGKFYMVGQAAPHPSVRNHMWDSIYTWSLIGDPSCEVWTSNPHAFSLPHDVTIEPDPDTDDGLLVHYATNYAVVTAFQNNTVVGRGVVHGNIAHLRPLRETYSEMLDFTLVISYPNIKPITLTASLS